MGKNSFVFHGDWLDVIDKFPDEIQLEIYRAMACYGLQREMPKLSPTAKIIMTVITTKLDEDNAKYKAICDKNRENAKSKKKKQGGDKQGVRKKEQPLATASVSSETNQSQRPLTTANDRNEANQSLQPQATVTNRSETSQLSIDIDIDNDIDIDKEKKETKKTSGRFIPPTVEEVDTYIREKGYHINASEWVNFYSSKGWMVGKNKMVKWKSAVATWEHRWLEERKNDKNATGFEQQFQAGATALERVSARVNARLSQKTAIDTNDLFSQPSDSDLQK